MNLEQAQKVIRSLPDSDPVLPAVLLLIRRSRAEALSRLKLPPGKLAAGEREFESGAFTALDDLGAELQALRDPEASPAG